MDVVQASDASVNVIFVVVAAPWVIGDNYDEMIESLSRLSDAELGLYVAGHAG